MKITIDLDLFEVVADPHKKRLLLRIGRLFRFPVDAERVRTFLEVGGVEHVLAKLRDGLRAVGLPDRTEPPR